MRTHETSNKNKCDDIMVVADTQSMADNIMNDFLFIIKDDPDFSCISRVRHTIYFKDNLGRIIFIGRNARAHMIQGFRGRTMTDDAFKMIMDQFISIRGSLHES